MLNLLKILNTLTSSVMGNENKLKENAPMNFHNCLPENRYSKFCKRQLCVCVSSFVRAQ